MAAKKRDAAPLPGPEGGEEEGAAVGRLRAELAAARAELRTVVEKLERANEELRGSNEEIATMNEELRSSNEELAAVNAQLQEKVRELERANDDLANLLECTDIATVFLDAGLCVKMFTPAATQLFRLSVSDVGRPLSDVARRFGDPELIGDALAVLRELAPREREVSSAGGSWWVRRVMPYRSRDRRVKGVVVTLADITERKLAADAVVRRLAAIVESSADAIFSKDLHGIVLTWNKGAERLFGHTADEIIGRSILITVPEDHIEDWKRFMGRLARGEYVEQIEAERVRKDGRRIAVALTYSPIRNGEGEVVSVSAIVRDTTERKRAEDALRESEQRFRLMADAAPVLIWVSGTDRLCSWFNKAWLDFVGRPMEQELGNGWAENVHPDDYDRCLKTYVTAFDTRQPFRMEYRLRRHDGEYRWVLDSGIPLAGAGGEFAGYIGSCIDIAERKRAEEALRDSEERLRAILNTVADAVITIDRRGIIQTVNPATERMFGFAAAELIGQSVNRLMPAPYREQHDGYLARYLRTGQRHVIGTNREVEACRKDGSVFPAELQVSEIEHLKLFTGVHRDLTQRRQLERDVVEIASREQHRIGQDLHDTVGQELTALNLLAADLAEALHTNPANGAALVKRTIDGLRRSQSALRTVLRGLVPVAVAREGLMAALADLADRTTKEGKVNCTFGCSAPVEVADNIVATHFFLIAQEAVHNAVKHARPANIRIRLESNYRLVLSVRCDGLGMSAPPDESKGLGLRIMRNRAAIIGASLTIEPAEPTGTLVTCALARTTHGPEEHQEASRRPDRR